MGKLKVYYNSACPVCLAGIRHQQRRMAGCCAEVDWIDIHRTADALKEIGASREFVRKRLHVLDDGQVRIGTEAFRVLWSRTEGQKGLALVFGLPVIRTLAQWTYNAFAALLYAWNRAQHRW